MTPKLIAFDLDGTFLNSQKKISAANADAMHEMVAFGVHIAFASGRLGSSMAKYLPQEIDNVSMLTLNGALVHTGKKYGSKLVYSATLPSTFADFLISYSRDQGIALNYYINDSLYAVRTEKTAPGLDLYFEQTGTPYNYVSSLEDFYGCSPSKVIFIADPAIIEREEVYFRKRWGESLYICRTWDHYLEFLDNKANKANGLKALARNFGIDMADVVAFGDANNDIPMLQAAGCGIAMANADPAVKNAAHKVSAWTNDDDGVAREWELLKKMIG